MKISPPGVSSRRHPIIQPDWIPTFPKAGRAFWPGVPGSAWGGAAGRDEALRLADGLFIHMDADVASDPAFKSPPFNGACPPARNACDWVRNHLTAILGGNLLPKVVFCIPAQDLEAWVLCALHPDVADENAPIECHSEPCVLLAVQSTPRLVRSKDGRLRKETAKYRNSMAKIVRGWPNCTAGNPPRCIEAARFELDAKRALGV